MGGYAVWLDLLGVAVFALTGALVASRQQMDLIGFGLMASVTGVGGGTLRDLLLERPVFWVDDPRYILVCLTVALLVYFVAPAIQRRYVVVLWADAVGISTYAVMGAHLALKAGAAAPVALVMGVMTATFGGLLRDVICNEKPLILKSEVYASAAAIGALVHILLVELGTSVTIAAMLGFLMAFAIRAGGIVYGLSLPGFKPRPPRPGSG
ncbi:trimeric intracellular cation channel family protein [Limibacillus sp. MBR-115]|jgi:uncharacterized membrane protein YeiH|uniref:trimeric intracellular cation channel family protein n=1 Tax=Limibacillus sp. MBR-115 TaxID=3156465 RepID=UPI003394C8FE